MNLRLWVITLLAMSAMLAPDSGSARIKLTTLPVRERVEVQLDHPDVTLVQEQRLIPLVRGVNQVDFSWANTRIDPDTILFNVLPHEGQERDVRVLSVSYPPNENALVWQVAAAAPGTALVRISYVIGGLTKSFSYRATAAPDEGTLDLSQYLLVRNLANESFGDTDLWAGIGDRLLQPIGINQTRQILISRTQNVPVRKTYTCDLADFGFLDEPQRKLLVPMHYVIVNDRASGLGEYPMPYGKVRIFQDDGHGTTAFLGEDWGPFTPRDDEMRLYLGVAQDIVVTRTIELNERHRIAGNLFRQEIIVKFDLENFKEDPVVLDVIENLSRLRSEVLPAQKRDLEWELGQRTTFDAGPDPERSTIDRVVFQAQLPPRGPEKAEKIEHRLHVFFHNEW